MPIWLRNFTFQQINDHYEEENNQAKQAQGNAGAARKALEACQQDSQGRRPLRLPAQDYQDGNERLDSETDPPSQEMGRRWIHGNGER